jgi:hypothetical protein
MLGRKSRWALVALAAVVLAFVAAGGPAAAKHFIDGSTIKPGTIGNKQLGRGSVSSTKLSRSLLRALKGRTGATGKTGAAGAAGATGPRGPAGAFNLVDAQGRVVGPFVGYYAGVFPQAYVNGVVFTWDNSTSLSPVVGGGSIFYYKATGCVGTPYTVSGLPLEFPYMLESPPVPGSTVYVETFGSGPESFNYQSRRTSTGCTDTAPTAVAGMLSLTTAGTVPAVTKPLHVVPAN